MGKRVSVVNQQAAVLTNCKEPAKKINEFAQRHKLFIFHLMRDFFGESGDGIHLNYKAILRSLILICFLFQSTEIAT